IWAPIRSMASSSSWRWRMSSTWRFPTRKRRRSPPAARPQNTSRATSKRRRNRRVPRDPRANRMGKRVALTGLGVITPIGTGKDAFWTGLMEGRSGVRRITAFDPAPYDTQIAGEIPGFDPTQFMDRKEVRRNDRFVQLALAATRLALDDSGFAITPRNADRVGVIIGSGIGGAGTWEEQHRVLLERGPGRVSPFFATMIIVNMASGAVSIAHGAKGPNVSVVSACATGGHAIGDAF